MSSQATLECCLYRKEKVKISSSQRGDETRLEKINNKLPSGKFCLVSLLSAPSTLSRDPLKFHCYVVFVLLLCPHISICVIGTHHVELGKIAPLSHAVHPPHELALFAGSLSSPPPLISRLMKFRYVLINTHSRKKWSFSWSALIFTLFISHPSSSFSQFSLRVINYELIERRVREWKVYNQTRAARKVFNFYFPSKFQVEHKEKCWECLVNSFRNIFHFTSFTWSFPPFCNSHIHILTRVI